MTAPVPPVNLDELEAALAAATPGPWSMADPRPDGSTNIDVTTVSDGWRAYTRLGQANTPDDAYAIVAAVNAAGALIAELRDLRAKVAAVRAGITPTPGLSVCGHRSVGGCARPVGHSGGHVAPSAYRPDAPTWAEDRARAEAADATRDAEPECPSQDCPCDICTGRLCVECGLRGDGRCIKECL